MDQNVNRFRQRRAKLLHSQIHWMAARAGRRITILDLGGRVEYWGNLPGFDDIAHIVLMNIEASELSPGADPERFSTAVGNACDLSAYKDKSIDLVHSNSVIEHVGRWPDMVAMAEEAKRVGRAGWIQTPAFAFPIEPHWNMPLVHWLGQPARRALMPLSKHWRKSSVADRRTAIDRTNLLSRAEMVTLFCGCEILTERFLGLPKSYTATWGPTW
jgi:hypothetical protein